MNFKKLLTISEEIINFDLKTKYKNIPDIENILTPVCSSKEICNSATKYLYMVYNLELEKIEYNLNNVALISSIIEYYIHGKIDE